MTISENSDMPKMQYHRSDIQTSQQHKPPSTHYSRLVPRLRGDDFGQSSWVARSLHKVSQYFSRVTVDTLSKLKATPQSRHSRAYTFIFILITLILSLSIPSLSYSQWTDGGLVLTRYLAGTPFLMFTDDEGGFWVVHEDPMGDVHPVTWIQHFREML